ncbi:hypothetical protein FBU30_005891 [Linnemannia zychae]|nr:hypothetical protein FBU30_005891 [Linnemannia zychae]
MADIVPQLIDFASQLDLQRVIVLQTTICLFAAIRSVPVYNIPLLFFGLYSYQHHDSVDPLQQFAGFTAFSILLDIVWCILSPGIGFGEALTIAVLLLKPISIISALQLLKYRGDPFSNLGEGFNWTSQRSHGYGNGLAYQSLAEGMEDVRDAEEISIPRHHHSHGKHRGSHQSGSFMTNSSRSGSVKSNRTGSGHNVELGYHGNGYDSSASGGGNSGYAVPAPVSDAPVGGGGGSVGGVIGSIGTKDAKDTKEERRNKVGQNFSEDEEEDITYKWLSRSLGISVNSSKELMQAYLTTVGKGKAHGTYYLARLDPESGNQYISLVSQENLDGTAIVKKIMIDLEPSPLKDIAVLSAINSEATQLQKGKDINLYRVVKNQNVVISASKSRPTSTATAPSTSSSSVFTKPKPGAKLDSKPSISITSSSTTTISTAISSTPSSDTPKTGVKAGATKGSMMNFFGKASASPATAKTSAPTPNKSAAKPSSTLNFKPVSSSQQKRKADLMDSASTVDSPRITRSNEESEEDEVDSEEERDRRLALSSRLDIDQDDVDEDSRGNRKLDVDSIKKKQRSARLLVADEDEDEDDEPTEAMSKEARAALNKEKETQRLALENMMLMDDTTTRTSGAEELEDEDSMMVDVEALDQVETPSSDNAEKTIITETVNASGTITRRRRGVRAVTKRRTFRNERGYMVTEDIVEMEPFSEDEIVEKPVPAPARAEKPVVVDAGSKKSETSGGPKKKSGGNQSLLNFFSKK